MELDCFNALPQTKMTRDIHCLTTWSKLNDHWEGVLIDDLLGQTNLEPPTTYTLAHSYGGYSTDVPSADLIGGKAMVANRAEMRSMALHRHATVYPTDLTRTLL